MGPDDLGAVAALGAFLGHLFPVWLGFKGGKGVATFLGVLLGLQPLAALAFALIWLGLAFTTPLFVALGAGRQRGDAHRPLAARRAAAWPGVAFILAALLWWKHSENISRLLAGTEGKIGQKG